MAEHWAAEPPTRKSLFRKVLVDDVEEMVEQVVSRFFFLCNRPLSQQPVALFTLRPDEGSVSLSNDTLCIPTCSVREVDLHEQKLPPKTVGCYSQQDTAVAMTRWCLLRLTTAYLEERLMRIDEDNAKVLKEQSISALSNSACGRKEVWDDPYSTTSTILTDLYRSICLLADLLCLCFLPFSTGSVAQKYFASEPLPSQHSAAKGFAKISSSHSLSSSLSVASVSSQSQFDDHGKEKAALNSSALEPENLQDSVGQDTTASDSFTAQKDSNIESGKAQSAVCKNPLNAWIIGLFERIIVFASGLGTTPDGIWDARLYFHLAVMQLVYNQPRLALEALRSARMIVEGQGHTAQSRSIRKALSERIVHNTVTLYTPPQPTSISLVLLTAKTLLNDLGDYPQVSTAPTLAHNTQPSLLIHIRFSTGDSLLR